MKQVFSLLGFFLFTLSFSQTNSKWQDWFSYNHIIDLSDTGEELLATTENGIFYYNPTSGEISKLSKTSGLHEVAITAAVRAEDGTVLIGYKSGNMDVVLTDGTVKYVVDIPLSTTVGSDKRSIRSLSISGNQAIVTAGYGVSIFKIDQLEFGDTCFFPLNRQARESVVKDGKVYVATNSGVYSQNLGNAFSNFGTWTRAAFNFTHLDAEGSNIVGTSKTSLYLNNGSGFTTLLGGFSNIQDVKISASNIVVTDLMKVSVVSLTGQLLDSFESTQNLQTGIVKNNIIYGGSKRAGILKLDQGAEKSIKPDGPYNNNSYLLRLDGEKIWVSTGGTKDYNLPNMSKLGYYYYDGVEWHYPDYFLQCASGVAPNCSTNDQKMNVLDVMPDPVDSNFDYFTNYATNGTQGVYRLNKTTNEIEKFIQNSGTNSYFRAAGLGEAAGKVIATIGYLKDPSNDGASGLFLPNQGDVFRFDSSIGGAQRPLITEKVIWYGNPRDTYGGMVALLYNGNINNLSNAPIKYIEVQEGLPSKSAISYAIDKYGDMWIGGQQGLRVLQDADNAIQGNNVKVNPIVIEQNGVGEELFRDRPVLAIAVDSGNRKWVSIEGGGIFYLSPDGQQTLASFTKDNSPLPNNSITDIQVDDRTGKVYFASTDGIVVYQSDVANVDSNFGNVVVYPNPVVYSKFKGDVTIKGLADKTNIRITDAAGNLVHKAVANGGVYYWNLNNERGARVASGIYFVLMTNADGTDTKAVKIAVVN